MCIRSWSPSWSRSQPQMLWVRLQLYITWTGHTPWCQWCGAIRSWWRTGPLQTGTLSLQENNTAEITTKPRFMPLSISVFWQKAPNYTVFDQSVSNNVICRSSFIDFERTSWKFAKIVVLSMGSWVKHFGCDSCPRDHVTQHICNYVNICKICNIGPVPCI